MLRRLMLGAATLLACGGLAAAAQGATPLYVSLTFDDGLQGDFTQVLPTLQKYGYQGTFYINSDKIATDAADRQTNYMLWSEIQQLQAAGMEIGGHTIGHTNLVTLWNTTYNAAYNATYDATDEDVNGDGTVDDADKVAAATTAGKTAATTAVGGNVCTDRNALVAHGFSPVSFAYPNGAWKLDDGSQYGDRSTIPGLIAGCGYSSARTTEGIAVQLPEPVYCDVCYAPISDTTMRPFSLRASQARGSQIAAEDGGGLPAQPGNDDLIPLSTLQGRTQLALDALHNPKPTDLPNPPPADGGWLILVLHDVCADENTLPCSPDTSVQSEADHGHSTTRAVLDAYLNWLKTRPSSDCVIVADVQTVMSPSRPTTCPVAPAKPTVSITGPANGSVVDGATNLTADANDADGSVSKVEFWVNGTLVDTDATSPYSVSWDPSSLAAGANATIVARAYDNADQTTDSSPITVSTKAATGGGGGTGGGGAGGGGGGGGGGVTKPVVTPPAAPVETPPAAPVTDAAPSQSAPQPAAPTVRLLKASSRMLRRGVIGFRAVVNAPAGVERVEFLANGKVVGTATEGPFRFSWSLKSHKGKTKIRKVKVSVRVIDSLGRVAESGDPVQLKVRLVAKHKRHR